MWWRLTDMGPVQPRSAQSLVVRSGLERTLSPVDQAYQHIMEGILSGELEPGMRIPTESVADTLGISRMPVRDALRRLEGDGVVTIPANRGASVAAYSPEEGIELTEMRAVLEGLAARIALQRVSEDAIEELIHLKHRMEKSEGELTRWMAIHDDFHNYLTCLSGRPLLSAQTARIRLVEKLSEVLHGPVVRVHAQVIGNVVSVIAQRRREEGQEPKAGYAQILHVIELAE